MLDNLSKDQKLGLAAATLAGGSIIAYIFWPKKAKAATSTTKVTTPTTTKKIEPERVNAKTEETALKSPSFFTDVNNVQWRITHNNTYGDGTKVPVGNAFVRAVVFNDDSLDGEYSGIWNGRYAEGKGSGLLEMGKISDYDYLKSKIIARINNLASQAKSEVDYYESAKSSYKSGSDGAQQERVSGVKGNPYYYGIKGFTGAVKSPYYYGAHGTGAVKNPYFYGTHGYYPSMSYAPLTEQRPGGIVKPHGAVGATNIGPIDIDPFYVEKITLKKRR